MNHAIVLSTYLFPVRRQSAGSSHRIGSMHFASLRFAVRIDINRRVSRFRFERWSSSSRYLSLARFVGPVRGHRMLYRTGIHILKMFFVFCKREIQNPHSSGGKTTLSFLFIDHRPWRW
jgi:hypothetical protein